MEFRKDVEGLRAVAVLPILLFHAGLSAIAGGFVGVDIFFVISGFLITSIIVKDMEKGEFKLSVFYSRRIVRIFPPLLLMLSVVLIFGLFNLFPVALRNLGQSVAASAGFVSNIYFWKTINYFAAAAELHPLLHTWSLGVEEQFYMVFPLFLMLVRRTPIPIRVWLLLMAVASFSIALWMTLHNMAKSEFYLLPSRAWELGIGGLVAVGCYPKVASKPVRQVLSVAGLGAIVAALAFVRSTHGFPAPWAALPVLGAAALIAYGRGCVTELLLSAPPMRWVGKVSYSLYLWHWPIIAFYRVNTGIKLSPVESVLLILASFAAAAISNRLVERPFTINFRLRAPRVILVPGLLAAAVVLTAGIGIAAQPDGWRKYSPEIASVLSYGQYTSTEEYRHQFRPGECFIEPASGGTEEAHCLRLSDEKKNIVVAGDSLAAHLWRAVAERYPEYNVLQATAPSCRATVDPVGTEACQAIANQVLGPMLDSGKLDAVVLSGKWVEPDLPKLERTLDRIRAKNIRAYVVGPTVAYDGEYPELLARAILTNNMALLDQTRVTERKVMSDRMAKLAAAHDAIYIAPYDLQCGPTGKCDLRTASGAPTHFDCCHLTYEEAQALVRRFPAI